MERKIGEVFDINGEWYQCVEGTGCYQCAFNRDENTCNADNLHCTCRSDKKDVVFKKLEKVGEPYMVYGHIVQKYKFFHSPAIQIKGMSVLRTINSTNTIKIEIKQNKEDMGDLDKIKVRDYTKVEELNVMEEKKQQADKLVTDYTANKITYKEFEKSIIELYADKHTEEKKLNIKPFDIQKAREGKPVCTRDGRKARIICFDLSEEYPIVARVYDNVGNKILLFSYKEDGKINNYDYKYDLMMLPEKRSGWVNIYNDIPIYISKEDAELHVSDIRKYIATAKVEWEE